MAIGRAYPIKKSAVKAYVYTKPPKKRHVSNGPRFAANGSVTHIAAINGRGAYRGRTARSRMSGLSGNGRRVAARSSLSAAKKAAFARSMRAEKKTSGSSARLRSNGSRLRVKRKTFKANRVKRARPRSPSRAAGHYERRATATVWVPARKTPKKISRRAKPARRKATRKTPMARKTRRRKKAAARSTPVRRVKRRVKRRKSAKRSAVAPKRRKRRKARKTTLKATPKRKRRRKAKRKSTTLKANRKRRSPRRRLKRNSGTRAGALKGWRKRRAKRKTTSKRRRSRKSSAVAPKRRRRRSRKTTNLRPRKRVRRRKARSTLKANRKRRSSRRRLSPNRRRRSSRRRLSANSRRRRSPARRRMRRNGRSRRMFRKNGVLDPILFIAKTGGIALLGLLGHKVITNAFVTYGLNQLLGSPAAVVQTTSTTSTVLPATSGLGKISLDPQYQRVLGSFLVAGIGVYASAKVIKDPTVRNTVMTGIGLSFMTTLFSAFMTKFAPQYSGILAGPNDGTAARLSAMYGFGGTSIQPRYQAISGRGMGEYFESGVNGMGEYFTSGMSGLGEYFTSGVSGLGSLPSYEANAGYGANPDLMEAAAGMGARETMNTNHIDPHGDLDRQLTIAEAAAGVGAFEAAAGFGNISTVQSSSTWVPGMSDGQLWAGTRSISSPQSATELTPAGILQTDGGQGVFG